MTKVIGIDPGLAATGIALVRGTGLSIDGFSYGDIATSKNISLPTRLEQIFSKIILILKDEKPDLMVIEDVFSLKSYPKSGILLGKVIGVILLAGCHAEVPSIEVPVREAKQILTGSGNATKIQLEKTVRHLVGLETPIRPYHASDAMSLALIGLFRYKTITKILSKER